MLVFVICRQKYLIYSREEKIGTWPLRLRYKAEVERLVESRVADYDGEGDAVHCWGSESCLQKGKGLT